MFSSFMDWSAVCEPVSPEIGSVCQKGPIYNGKPSLNPWCPGFKRLLIFHLRSSFSIAQNRMVGFFRNMSKSAKGELENSNRHVRPSVQSQEYLFLFRWERMCQPCIRPRMYMLSFGWAVLSVLNMILP